MSKYYLLHDNSQCIECHACEVQCKVNKSLPVGPKPCQVFTIGPQLEEKLPRATYVFVSCYHCKKPLCADACPIGAIQIRPDGIVFINKADCAGCKACIPACPWGALQWDSEAEQAVKCDYCMDRIDQGLKPACVNICATQCLDFTVPDQIPKIKRYVRVGGKLKIK